MVIDSIQEDKELKRKRVIRIDGDLYRRLVRVTKKKNMTITAGAEKGISGFVDFLDYTYETLLEELNKQPILRVNKELFSKVFKDADRETIQAVISILRRGIINFYKNSFEELDKTIEEINNSSCTFAVPIVRVSLGSGYKKEEEEKIRLFFEKVNRLNCENDGQFLPDSSLESSENGSFLIFVLKKEETKKEDEASKE